ncbi:protein kish-A isoform X1 [Peromyscus californicus insignis]|uniref:protein kish-A isoform X1 n=1 Tax=Peromyscus californicus insignis TaxID=564181 RepID=UPI0022A73044|nr:protein kish-A isoform X1 [Peromyscus californicus insignis]
MRESANSKVCEAPPTARLFRSREPITESEWHSLGGGAAIGPTGRLERAGSAAGVHPLPPRPGRVMWLDQHRPHYDYWEYFGSVPELVSARVLMLPYAV